MSPARTGAFLFLLAACASLSWPAEPARGQEEPLQLFPPSPSPEVLEAPDGRPSLVRQRLWRGVSPERQGELLSLLPETIVSPGARALALELLKEDFSLPELEDRRSESLRSLGAWDRLLPSAGFKTQLRHRAGIEALLLQGEAGKACGQVEENLPRFVGEPFWQAAAIFCQLRTGRNVEATIALDLLRERGGGPPGFLELGYAKLGLAKPPRKPAAEPLLAALALLLEKPPALSDFAAPSGGFLAALSRLPLGGAEERLEAAEQAAALGALAPEELASRYRTFPLASLSGQETEGKQEKGEDRVSAGRRAALLQQTERSASLGLEPLADFLLSTYATRLEAAASRIAVPWIEKQASPAAHPWFAPIALRALLLSGEAQAALPWLSVLGRGSGDREPQEDPLSYWPLGRLAGLASRPGFDHESWKVRVLAMASSTQSAGEKLLLQGALFAGLGEPEGTGWIGPAADATESSALLSALRQAAASRREGETLALSLALLGKDGPAEASPLVLHEVLAALRDIGHGGTARTLAREAAWLRGL